MSQKKIMNNKILTASIWNFAGTFLLKAIAYLSIPIFTRILSPEDYGYVSTYTTYISFLGLAIGMSLNTATTNARIDFEERFCDYNSTIMKISFLIFAMEFTLGSLLFKYIGPMLSIDKKQHFNLLFFIAYAEYIINTYYKINTVDFKFKENLKISVTNSIVSLMLSVFLVYIFKEDITAKLLGQSLFILIVGSIFFVKIAFLDANSFCINDIKYAKKIAIPNIFHQAAQMIMSQSDRIIILNMCGAVTAGKYSVVYSFGLIMQMVWNAINEVWVPWLYRALSKSEEVLIIKMSRIYLYIFTVVSATALLVAPDFMIIIAPESYLDAKDMIVPVLLATYFMFLYSFFANVEIYNKKNKYMAICTIIAAIVNVTGNYLLIPVFGYKAAAYTTLLAYVILMLLHFVFLTVVFKLNFYGFRMFIMPIFFMLIISTVVLITVNLPLYRYSILMVMIFIGMLLGYKNKKSIVAFIDTFRR